MDKKIQGKKNREAGQRFEVKVRKDLESKGWIVDKWSNNVEFKKIYGEDVLKKKIDIDKISWNIESKEIYDQGYIGKLIPSKHKFRGPGIPMAIGTGFPDFIAFKDINEIALETPKAIIKIVDNIKGFDNVSLEIERAIKTFKKGKITKFFEVIGVECKSNGYLTKEEKEKCKWYLENNTFSKILIAKKGLKRGEIIYEDFSEKYENKRMSDL